MVHTQASTPLSAVMVERRGPLTDVWLRRDVTTFEDDGVTYWEADETYGVIEGVVTEEEVSARFNGLWDEFEEDGLTDRELMVSRVSEMSDAIAELSEMASDGAVDIADIADGIAELSADVSRLFELVEGGE